MKVRYKKGKTVPGDGSYTGGCYNCGSSHAPDHILLQEASSGIFRGIIEHTSEETTYPCYIVPVCRRCKRELKQQEKDQKIARRLGRNLASAIEDFNRANLITLRPFSRALGRYGKASMKALKPFSTSLIKFTGISIDTFVRVFQSFVPKPKSKKQKIKRRRKTA